MIINMLTLNSWAAQQEVLPRQDSEAHGFGTEKVSFQSTWDALPAAAFLGKRIEIHHKLEMSRSRQISSTDSIKII